MLKKAAALLLVCASTAISLSCVTNSNHYVYAAVPNLNEILAYREDPNSGVLTQLAFSPFTAGQSVESIVVHPSNKFLYAANAGEGDVSLFTIANGILTEQFPRMKVGVAPNLLAMDAAGSTLYVADVATNSITLLSIDASTGVLSTSGSPVTIGTTPLNMKVSPSGIIYVTGSTGTGTTSQGVIEVWNLTAQSPLVQLIQTGGLAPQGLAITPMGGFLYIGNFQSNTISGFSIGSDGSLTGLSGFPLAEAYSGPINLLVDNSGKFLYVANKTSGNVAGYNIGAGGGLTLLSDSPFAAGTGTSFIASDPNGKHLVVGTQGSTTAGSQLLPFSLDTGSGTLAPVTTYNLGNAPSSIVVSE